MPREQSAALVSLAVLRVNADRQRSDYIDNFVPFIAQALIQAPQRQVSAPELQAIVRSEFGIRMPQSALKTVLRRAVRHGYAKVENRIYVRDETALASLDLRTARDAAMTQHEALVGRLVAFAKNEHGESWTNEQAEGALLAFVHERAATLIASSTTGSPLPAPSPEAARDEFITHSFVVRLFESDPLGFRALDSKIRGSVFASVLYFPELSDVSQSLRGVTVYFDTRILLHLLGTAGDIAKMTAEELVSLTTSVGATVACFEHTVSEVRGVLATASHAIRDPAFRRQVSGESIEHLLRSGTTWSDAEVLIESIEDRLRSSGIAVRRRPAPEAYLTVNEAALEEKLKSVIRYPRDEVLRHDVESLTAIYRLRRGSAAARLDHCTALFVTTNDALARASREFFSGEYEESPIPVCLPEQQFGTLVWLKRPQSESELPIKQAIADCYAALSPADSLWSLYVRELATLEERGDLTAENYHILRYSTSARAALMDFTHGDTEAFSEGTIPEVLERALDNVRADLETELRAERAAVARVIEQMTAAQLAAASELGRKEERRERMSLRIGYMAATAIFTLLALLVVTGTVLGIYQLVAGTSSGITSAPAALVVLAVLNVLGIFGALFGTSLIGIRASVQRWVAGRAMRALPWLAEGSSS